MTPEPAIPVAKIVKFQIKYENELDDANKRYMESGDSSDLMAVVRATSKLQAVIELMK